MNVYRAKRTGWNEHIIIVAETFYEVLIKVDELELDWEVGNIEKVYDGVHVVDRGR